MSSQEEIGLSAFFVDPRVKRGDGATHAASSETQLGQPALNSALAGNSDYYDILGVKKGCSASDVKRAYQQLALKMHPDRSGNSANEEMSRVTEAWNVLKNPALRAVYDKHGMDGLEAWYDAQASSKPGSEVGVGGGFQNGDVQKLSSFIGREAELRAELDGAKRDLESSSRGLASCGLPVSAAAKTHRDVSPTNSETSITSGNEDITEVLRRRSKRKAMQAQQLAEEKAALQAELSHLKSQMPQPEHASTFGIASGSASEKKHAIELHEARAQHEKLRQELERTARRAEKLAADKAGTDGEVAGLREQLVSMKSELGRVKGLKAELATDAAGRVAATEQQLSLALADASDAKRARAEQAMAVHAQLLRDELHACEADTLRLGNTLARVRSESAAESDASTRSLSKQLADAHKDLEKLNSENAKSLREVTQLRKACSSLEDEVTRLKVACTEARADASRTHKESAAKDAAAAAQLSQLQAKLEAQRVKLAEAEAAASAKEKATSAETAIPATTPKETFAAPSFSGPPSYDPASVLSSSSASSSFYTSSTSSFAASKRLALEERAYYAAPTAAATAVAAAPVAAPAPPPTAPSPQKDKTSLHDATPAPVSSAAGDRDGARFTKLQQLEVEKMRAEHQKSVEKAQAQVEGLRGECFALRAEVKELKHANAQLQDRAQGLIAKQSDAQLSAAREGEDTKAAYEARLEALKSRLDDALREGDARLAAQHDLRKVLSEASETESALRKELAHALGEQESLARLLESSRVAAAAAERARNERVAEGAALRAEVANAEADVGAIKAWAKHAVGSSAALKAQVEGERSGNTWALEKALAQLENVRAECANTKMQSREVMFAKKDLEQQVTKLLAETRLMKATIEEEAQVKRVLQEELRDARAAINDPAKAMQLAAKETEEAEKKAAAKLPDVNELKEEIARLKSEAESNNSSLVDPDEVARIVAEVMQRTEERSARRYERALANLLQALMSSEHDLPKQLAHQAWAQTPHNPPELAQPKPQAAAEPWKPTPRHLAVRLPSERVLTESAIAEGRRGGALD